MKLDFLDDLIAFATQSSIWIQLAVKALTFLAAIFPEAARYIKDRVVEFFDLFDKQTEAGTPPTLEDKERAEAIVVVDTLETFHGSGTLISRSWAKSIANAYVYVIGAQRYGEDAVRNEAAVLKGYMSTAEEMQNAQDMLAKGFGHGK